MRAYVADRRTSVETALTCVFRPPPVGRGPTELTPPLVSSGSVWVPTIVGPEGR